MFEATWFSCLRHKCKCYLGKRYSRSLKCEMVLTRGGITELETDGVFTFDSLLHRQRLFWYTRMIRL